MQGVQHTTSKEMRISTLEPLVSNKLLWFRAELPEPYMQQFREFIPEVGANSHDDGPDATEMVVAALRGHLIKRDYGRVA